VVHKIRGAQFEWGGARGEFLWPPDTGPMKEAANDDSLVLRIADGPLHFLLAGDAQQRAEDQIVRDGEALSAEFLKVPHHGSKTSSTPSFLAAVKPAVAVVSVGEGNPFGHPAESIVARYAQAGVHLLRTDHDGVVSALTDGKSLRISTFAGGQREVTEVLSAARSQ
jgi:competence protein ComEC